MKWKQINKTTAMAEVNGYKIYIQPVLESKVKDINSNKNN